ncbi:MAG: methionyl-tRNA formyltransferase [Bacteroidetes bacterium]|uniref:Methionyl-tRNA formyltransferase n=1 Tax=Candidatus Cryptobacteroides faecigallinarum TaxID=2840763 RepID=A0A9D9NIQ3_9BACT|nr:methionyl-tRNA formyltransferase [Candidatus Cryptobacteroides faecigallinarum]
MKKLDQFILKSFIGPFVAILLVVIFILMMQFLWLYIDELVGKGLSFKVILEFLGWGSITLIPLSLPLATLLASMMTLGTLGENNELLAIKAAGISLKRVLVPLICASAVISVGAFFISNDLIPVAYNKIFTLRDDIGRTKEEIKIPTGTFYDGIDGYVLRVDSRNDDTGMMYGVMVYNHTGKKGNTSLTLADSAMMKMTEDKKALTFTLFSGGNYEETNTRKFRDTTLQLQKIDFQKQSLVIPLENYAFQKSEDTRFDDEVKSMNLKQLEHSQDSIGGLAGTTRQDQLKTLTRDRTIRFNSQLDTAKKTSITSGFDYAAIEKEFDIDDEIKFRQQALNSVNEYISTLTTFSRETYHYNFLLRRIDVEILKKFALAIACFIFFFIGAPLGALIRKGGLGTPAIISVLFFVLYWVIDITGTKLANDGAVSAGMGVFISSYVLFPLGMFLTYKAINDSSILNMEKVGILVKKLKNAVLGRLRKTRIVFMGTPEFAVASLDALKQNGYNIAGVVTVADKASGRGMKIHESAVKKYAVEHNIPVLQPVSLKDPEFLEALSSWKADLFVVVAFRMLPKVVWEMPRLGTFNLHAALLPQYRGAAPINWAVINGDHMTGVTTFMIDDGMDTGHIIYREQCRIEDTDTAGDLHDKLMEIGARIVVQTVDSIIDKNIELRLQKSFIQGSEVLRPAPKLTRELCHIDWNDSTKHIYNLIRGLSPVPAAFTELTAPDKEPVQMKIYYGEQVTGQDYLKILAENGRESAPAGTVLSDGKSYLAISTADGAISVKDLQLAGKRRMEVKDFLIGFRDPTSYGTSAGTSSALLGKHI